MNHRRSTNAPANWNAALVARWAVWLDRTTGNASNREIGRRAGYTHTTVGRWRRGAAVSADGVIAIARAYGADPVDGLVSAGLLTEGDLIGGGGLRNAVRHAPVTYLAEELHERAVTGRLDDGFEQLHDAPRSWI